MADGYAPPLLADGIYLDLEMWRYLDDPAIGGHGVIKLASSPCDFRWERRNNPLYREPASDARADGTLLPKAGPGRRGAFNAT